MSAKPTMSEPRLEAFLDSAPVKPNVPEPPAPPAPATEAAELSTLRANKPKKEGTFPLNVRIPISLHEDLKDLAYWSGVSMTEVIVELIRSDVKRRKAALKKGA